MIIYYVILIVGVVVNLDQWKELLNDVKPGNGSTEGDLLKQIKKKLEKQDHDTYKKWEKNGFNVDHKFESSQLTLLHLAARYGYTDMAESLIEKGAKLNEKDDDGLTPLHWAARSGYGEVIETLLNKGANINAICDWKRTPLHFAALRGHKEAVEILIANGAKVCVKDEDGITPLHLAAEGGNREIINALIVNGANEIDIKDIMGRTPLALAVNGSNEETVKCLIHAGADVNVHLNSEPILYLAIRKRSVEIAKILIAHEVKLKGSEIQKPDYPTKHREMSEYWDKCLDEVTKMKEEKIDRGITFYDIFTSREEDRLANYMRNEQVVKALEEGSYRSKFPIYVNDLEHLFKIGKQRLDALNKATEIIKKMEHKKHKELFDKLTAEPDIVYNIVRHFSNKDIEDLRKAVIQTMDEEDVSQSLGSDVRIEPAAKKQGRQA